MGVTGDFAKLDTLRAGLRQLTAAGFKREIADELGRTTMALVANEFRYQRDPYGDAWQPLKRERPRNRRARLRAQAAGKKSRGQKILQDTGRMRASVNFQPEANGFRVNIPVKYAPVHQSGATIPARTQKLRGRYTKTGQFRFAKKKQTAILLNAQVPKIVIPQRMMLPTRARGLGPIYLAAYNRAVAAMIRRKLQVAA